MCLLARFFALYFKHWLQACWHSKTAHMLPSVCTIGQALSTRAADTVVSPHLLRSSCPRDRRIGAVVATLLGAWRHRMGARTAWHVSIGLVVLVAVGLVGSVTVELTDCACRIGCPESVELVGSVSVGLVGLVSVGLSVGMADCPNGLLLDWLTV